MSRDLSSRSGDGDAASNKRKTNCRSRSSSYRGRTDEENLKSAKNEDLNKNTDSAGLEGPYGDSPTERQRHHQEEYVILMISGNSRSSPTSENDQELELYNLRNSYIQKLNIVRRRLNLLDVTDDSANTTYRGACKITEITEDTAQEPVNVVEIEEGDISNVNRQQFIQPVFQYNNFTNSNPNFLEMEYTPPKKKTCHRLKTPELSSASEVRKIPFHSPHVWRRNVNKFTKNVETQCNIGSLSRSRPQTENISDIPENSWGNGNEVEICTQNLFPEVIIKKHPSKSFSLSRDSDGDTSNEENLSEVSEVDDAKRNDVIQSTDIFHRITSPPKCIARPNNYSSIRGRSDHAPNFIDDSSEDYYNTGTTSTTTILESKSTEKQKNRNRKKVHNRSSLWEHLKKMHSLRIQEGSKHEENYFPNKLKVRPNHTSTYAIKSSLNLSKDRKMKDVPFTSRVVMEGAAPCHLNHKYFYFSSDTDYRSSVFDSSESPREPRSLGSCWDNLVQFIANIFRKQKLSDN